MKYHNSYLVASPISLSMGFNDISLFDYRA